MALSILAHKFPKLHFYTMDRNALKEKDIRRRGKIRIYYDMMMGGLWLVAGIYFIVNKYIGLGMGFDSLTASIFGIVCVAYGLFRLYRAFTAKKDI